MFLPEEFENRMDIMKNILYLVIERDGRSKATSTPMLSMGAPPTTGPVSSRSIWITTRRNAGLAEKLYEVSADRLKDMGVLNLYACIGYPKVEDEYLNKNSAQFHEHLGFRLCGTF